MFCLMCTKNIRATEDYFTFQVTHNGILKAESWVHEMCYDKAIEVIVTPLSDGEACFHARFKERQRVPLAVAK